MSQLIIGFLISFAGVFAYPVHQQLQQSTARSPRIEDVDAFFQSLVRLDRIGVDLARHCRTGRPRGDQNLDPYFG